MRRESVIVAAVLGLALGTSARPAAAWWGNGHETIAQGAVADLVGAGGTGDLYRFFSETGDQFSKIPHIEPAGTHFIDIDASPFATDFANFRAGTFTFPTTSSAASARYGSTAVANNSGPWTANDLLTTLTTKMRTARTYMDWYQLEQTAGAMTHYIEDLHQPMHLTVNYNPNGLHGIYEGGQFENGTVRRYPELRAAITPVPLTYYGTGPGFINAVFARIPTDYDKNVLILNAAAAAHGSGAAYYDDMWNRTKVFTKDSFQDGATMVASAINTAYINAGSPVIPAATFYATPVREQSSITISGPVSDYTNEDFFRMESGYEYGVARFDFAKIKSQYDARYGAGNWAVDNVTLALTVNSQSAGSVAVFFSPNDSINIQAGSSLRYADNGGPLGVNIAADLAMLRFTSTGSTYSIVRYDSTTASAFDWTPMGSDILGGEVSTLVFASMTSGRWAGYFGGSGISLEVYAHAVPDVGAGGAGWAVVGAFLGLVRRGRRG